ncbi:cupin domain-containing protein [Kineococcus esterisolvens]|uniref:cupin n=1 Tax=unclassified Kineococcus TaxID=2621656 RepID=UPI003D7DFAEC
MVDLRRVTDEHLGTARSSPHGRSAELLVHDGHLRQTLIALRAGEGLGEHNSPQAASLHVLTGRVRVSGDHETEVSTGELVVLTHQRHAVAAVEDSAFLLTTVTGLPDGDPTI